MDGPLPPQPFYKNKKRHAYHIVIRPLFLAHGLYTPDLCTKPGARKKYFSFLKGKVIPSIPISIYIYG
jgi:hypothetical protein